MNELVVVKTSAYQGEKTHDKHGKANVWLKPIAGKLPNQTMVLAGTVAEKEEIGIGQTLLVMVTEGTPDPEFGRQFSVTKLDTVAGRDILGYRKELGEAIVIDTKNGTAAPVEDDETDEELAAKLQGKAGNRKPAGAKK